jgi:hypothetical protein
LKKNTSGLSEKLSACLTKTSWSKLESFTNTAQYGPNDKLYIFPYFSFSFLFVCNKSLPNKLVKFPMNGKGVGPGGISTGRRDLTQKNVKTNDTRIKERFQPLNSSKI